MRGARARALWFGVLILCKRGAVKNNCGGEGRRAHTTRCCRGPCLLVILGVSLKAKIVGIIKGKGGERKRQREAGLIRGGNKGGRV